MSADRVNSRSATGLLESWSALAPAGKKLRSSRSTYTTAWLKRPSKIVINGLPDLPSQEAITSGHVDSPRHLGASMPPRKGMGRVRKGNKTSCILPQPAMDKRGQVADDNTQLYEGALAASVSLVL